MKALPFQKALEAKLEEVMKDFKEKVLKALKNDILDSVHPDDMSVEQKKLIIPQMMNYLEKY
jgi:hypothetical protein